MKKLTKLVIKHFGVKPELMEADYDIGRYTDSLQFDIASKEVYQLIADMAEEAEFDVEVHSWGDFYRVNISKGGA